MRLPVRSAFYVKIDITLMLMLLELKKILGSKRLPNWLNFPCYSKKSSTKPSIL